MSDNTEFKVNADGSIVKVVSSTSTQESPISSADIQSQITQLQATITQLQAQYTAVKALEDANS